MRSRLATRKMSKRERKKIIYKQHVVCRALGVRRIQEFLPHLEVFTSLAQPTHLSYSRKSTKSQWEIQS